MGLDRPIPIQLVHYLGDIATGNLGRSLTTGQPVAADIRERLPASLESTFTALFIALVLSIPLGVVAALRPGSGRSPCAHAVYAGGLRADVRFGSAADLYFLLFAGMGAGSDCPTGYFRGHAA